MLAGGFFQRISLSVYAPRVSNTLRDKNNSVNYPRMHGTRETVRALCARSFAHTVFVQGAQGTYGWSILVQVEGIWPTGAQGIHVCDLCFRTRIDVFVWVWCVVCEEKEIRFKLVLFERGHARAPVQIEPRPARFGALWSKITKTKGLKDSWFLVSKSWCCPGKVSEPSFRAWSLCEQSWSWLINSWCKNRVNRYFERGLWVKSTKFQDEDGYMLHN